MTAIATGGCDGQPTAEDGSFAVKLATSKGLGGAGGAGITRSNSEAQALVKQAH